MPAIKHHEILRDGDYFKGGTLPCVVREMRDAPSNAFIAMHDHEFSELVIVASGKISHIHSDRTDKLSKGDFFAIHPGERHGYAQLAPKTIVFNVLYHRERPPLPLSVLGFPLMNEIFPEDPASVHANTLGRVTRSNLPAVLQLIDLIRREEHLDQPLRRTTCESLFTSLLLLLARSTQRVSVPSRESPVQKEIDFITKNLSRKITLDELCGISGKSVRTLHREFRKAVGKSPGDYIIDMRIAKAKVLLGRKGSTLKKVAAKTGFCCAAHLSRTLRRTKPE
ncbi:MAG: helix-turn-helix domain-containing protein [Kiritimatiellae bacterium]|nr:helix-turn-helix domain-containing protein [Kiritimatiellia bacterium]